jgi:hypothetical protein
MRASFRKGRKLDAEGLLSAVSLQRSQALTIGGRSHRWNAAPRSPGRRPGSRRFRASGCAPVFRTPLNGTHRPRSWPLPAMQGTRPFSRSCPRRRVPKGVKPVVSGLIPCRHHERARVPGRRPTVAAQLQGHAWTLTADRPKGNKLLMENVIREVFNEVWKRQKGTEPPALDADTLLLEIGLDSLGFAIVVTQLDEKLGFDPFSIAQDAYYPQTFGEFVAFYKKYAPKI